MLEHEQRSFLLSKIDWESQEAWLRFNPDTEEERICRQD